MTPAATPHTSWFLFTRPAWKDRQPTIIARKIQEILFFISLCQRKISKIDEIKPLNERGTGQGLYVYECWRRRYRLARLASLTWHILKDYYIWLLHNIEIYTWYFRFLHCMLQAAATLSESFITLLTTLTARHYCPSNWLEKRYR